MVCTLFWRFYPWVFVRKLSTYGNKPNGSRATQALSSWRLPLLVPRFGLLLWKRANFSILKIVFSQNIPSVRLALAESSTSVSLQHSLLKCVSKDVHSEVAKLWIQRKWLAKIYTVWSWQIEGVRQAEEIIRIGVFAQKSFFGMEMRN